MYVTRHALLATVVHSSCAVCHKSLCIQALGMLSDEDLQQIREVVAFCEEHQPPGSVALWQDEEFAMRGINHATHEP